MDTSKVRQCVYLQSRRLKIGTSNVVAWRFVTLVALLSTVPNVLYKKKNAIIIDGNKWSGGCTFLVTNRVISCKATRFLLNLELCLGLNAPVVGSMFSFSLSIATTIIAAAMTA